MRARFLSFRLKLLLAMSAAVAIVSLTTLLVTQGRVRSDYEKMFRRQFDRQVNYFTALQDARLGGIEEDCLRLCKSPRVLAALEGPDIDPEIASEEAALAAKLVEERNKRGDIIQYGQEKIAELGE